MKRTIFLISVLTLIGCTCLPQIPPQYIQADENCEGVLPNYLQWVTVKDNCQGAIPTQSPLPGTILDAANPWIVVTIEVKDISGNMDQERFDVILTDNVPPELIIDSLGFADTIAYHRNDIDLLIDSVEKYRRYLGINDSIADSTTWKTLTIHYPPW